MQIDRPINIEQHKNGPMYNINNKEENEGKVKL